MRDPNTLILLQEWESARALDNHFRTEHVRAFMDAIPKVLAGKVLTRRYTILDVADETDSAKEAGAERSRPPIIH